MTAHDIRSDIIFSREGNPGEGSNSLCLAAHHYKFCCDSIGGIQLRMVPRGEANSICLNTLSKTAAFGQLCRKTDQIKGPLRNIAMIPCRKTQRKQNEEDEQSKEMESTNWIPIFHSHIYVFHTLTIN
ncbi:Uncharacterized protein TCM_021837 [Theobroma cacao]|uniref:Uncharacterized protein n=1 Tax=Theobroma cacao TaxID=3641 RepID=A0A061ESL7_THECC|nr:Uncharacterized protein TCM_021837 [Theobroma cacao]